MGHLLTESLLPSALAMEDMVALMKGGVRHSYIPAPEVGVSANQRVI